MQALENLGAIVDIQPMTTMISKNNIIDIVLQVFSTTVNDNAVKQIQ